MFLKSIDRKTWNVVVTRWEHLTVTYADGKISPKLKIARSNAEDKASLENSQALNTNFNGVDQNVF